MIDHNLGTFLVKFVIFILFIYNFCHFFHYFQNCFLLQIPWYSQFAICCDEILNVALSSIKPTLLMSGTFEQPTPWSIHLQRNQNSLGELDISVLISSSDQLGFLNWIFNKSSSFAFFLFLFIGYRIYLFDDNEEMKSSRGGRWNPRNLLCL